MSRYFANDTWSWLKRGVVILGGGAAASVVLFAVYKHYSNRETESSKDEGFVDVSKPDEPAETKVLVLGLEGSGKSSLLLGLSSNGREMQLKPTEGVNVVHMNSGSRPLSLWEVGGAGKMRKYWNSFIQDTHVLVYVVDSADDKQLPESFTELHRILGDERLAHVPIVIVANKQDLPGALDQRGVLQALGMDNVNRRQIHVECLGTEVPPTGLFTGVAELKELLLRLTASRHGV